ncbi:hypothetical protein BGC_47850 [Burkholderia sp. 3C]
MTATVGSEAEALAADVLAGVAGAAVLVCAEAAAGKAQAAASDRQAQEIGERAQAGEGWLDDIGRTNGLMKSPSQGVVRNPGGPAIPSIGPARLGRSGTALFIETRL